MPLPPPEAECEDEQQDFPSEAAQLSLASELFLLQPKYCDAGTWQGWWMNCHQRVSSELASEMHIKYATKKIWTDP